MNMKKIDIIKYRLECGIGCKYIPELCDVTHLALAVKYGSNNDILNGTAHFLEHMLLEFNSSDISYHSNFSIIGTTMLDHTVYTISFTTNHLCFREALFILQDISSGANLKKEHLEKVRQDLVDEYVRVTNQATYHMYKELFEKYHISEKYPLGTLDNIKKISYKDLIVAYKSGYNNTNMCLSVVGAPYKWMSQINTIFKCPGYGRNESRQKKPNIKTDDIFGGPPTLDYVHVFFKVDTNILSLKNHEIIESIAITLIEELFKLIINKADMEAFPSVIRFDRTNYFIRYLFKNDNYTESYINEVIHDVLCLLRRDEQLSNLINEIIKEYNLLLNNEEFNSYNYNKHLVECFLYDLNEYRNEDLLEELNNITPRDVLLFSVSLISTCGHFIYFMQ